MLERAALAVGIGLLAIACGGGPNLGGTDATAGESSSLMLSGPVRADFSNDKGGACAWKPAAFVLTFTTGDVQGTRVEFTAQVGVGAVGDPDAATPATADGLTPLVVRSGGKAIKAASGTIHVTDGDVTAHTFKGSVEAVMEDGTKVTGSWSCTATLA
jgi:hypothetical protein